MMTYHKEQFNNADRSKFLKALAAEGVSLSTYISNGLHKEPWAQNILKLKSYQKMYTPAQIQHFKDSLNCPNCDKACEDILMIWASGPLLGTREDMDDVANAILKVYENRDKLGAI